MKDIKNIILFEALLKKCHISEYMPGKIKKRVLNERRKSLVSVLKKLELYSPLYGLLLRNYIFIQKIGFKPTIRKSAIFLFIILFSLLSILVSSYFLIFNYKNQNFDKIKTHSELKLEKKSKTKTSANKPQIISDDNDDTGIEKIIDEDLKVDGIYKTWNGDFEIKSKDDILKIKDYNRISGTLKISNSSVANIDKLKNLISVGKISIYGNKNLKNIDGLNNIKEVIGGIEIINNNIENFNSFNNLISTKGPIKIKQNNIKELNGFSKLTISKDNILIAQNNNLLNINAFKNLHQAKKYLIILNNKNLNKISKIENLKFINNLTISNNSNLKKIDSFTKLQIIGKKLFIGTNDSLVDINFPSLYKVTNEFNVSYNKSISRLDGFKKLKSIGTVFTLIKNESLLSIEFNIENNKNLILNIRRNYSIDSISFPKLKNIHSIFLVENSALKSINLPAIQEITDNLVISQNISLENLLGFKNLKKVGNNINITGNKSLKNTQKFLERFK